MMKYLGATIDSGIFHNLNKSEYVTAFEELSIIGKSLKKGDVIFRQGDEINKICIVDKGSVRSEKSYPSGELHIIQIYDKGTIFGIEEAVSMKKTTPTDYICNENSTVIFIPINNIGNSSFNKPIYEFIMEQLANENIRKMHKIEILAEKGLRKRILMYLDILRKKAGCDEVSVKMSREQLAQYLCVNRSALSNELNKMKREKIIDFEKDKFRFL